MPKSNPNSTAIILAAGKGTRMHSSRPKVLQTLLGEPMLAYVISAITPLFNNPPLIVAGHGASELEKAFPESHFVLQAEQKGTGHALGVALPEIPESICQLMVLNGDSPLVTTAILEDFLSRANGADLAFATLTLSDPGSYGRVYRKNGKPSAIIEAKDYDPEKHGPVSGEINAGLYLIKTQAARELLPALGNANSSGEYYLTDLVELASKAGLNVAAISMGDDNALLGVNSPIELAMAEEILQKRVIAEKLASGAIIHNANQARISPFAAVEPGAEISGPCIIFGKTSIHKGAIIEAFCSIKDSEIMENAHILQFCHLEGARVDEGAQAGPYARLRPGAHLEAGSRVGNFVELKNTRLGKGSKANHLTYLGDARIGNGANIGAGTITCNYDGRHKHQTTIGDNAFIGSNAALVAPVNIGANALVGAGSVITKDVQENELGIGRSRQQNLPLRKK